MLTPLRSPQQQNTDYAFSAHQSPILIMSDETKDNGWTAVSRSLEKLLANRKDTNSKASPLRVEDMPLPDSPLAKSIMKHAQEHLPKQTFSHSMRVYYFGQAITMQHFPEWHYSPETYLLASLLHDIGTTDTNMAATNLSFEFQGGMQALQLVLKNGASKSAAESVCETIIRHQDVGESGNITTLTAVIHFATLLDNAGKNPELVHQDTIENVVKAWPREGWTGCFAGTVRKETKLKPWSHTTKIEGFAEMVEANETMRPYD
ncbi:cyanamide hydratase [Aureobasidium subglaciale]|nr:cyanamide hydratase [Aureobasidium subglaciale]KAI5220848.1 cyanamide hydratase [Aureobasidium subglaciale]KAI5260864.1 cyanamide hydratase [Aureobasidium subglaciale]